MIAISERDGYRMVVRDHCNVATDSDEQWARSAKFAAAIQDATPTGASVLIIGGGFCTLPRLLHGYVVTICEIEPALATYCPSWCVFIARDWHDLPASKFDVVVYDLGGPVPDALRVFLTGDGLLLGDNNGNA